MDLADHLRVISANWWRILLIAALVGVGVFVFSYNLPNTYEGFTLVNVAPAQLSNGAIISQETMAFRVAAYAQLLKTRNVADAAAVKLRNGPRHYQLSAAAVRGRLGVVPNNVAGLIGITASAHSQQEAMDISNAYAQALNDASLQQARADYNTAKANLEREIRFGQLLINQTPASDTASTAKYREFIAERQTNLAGLELNTGDPVIAPGPATLNNDGAPVAPRPTRDGTLAFLVAFVVTAESFVVARALSDRFARAA